MMAWHPWIPQIISFIYLCATPSISGVFFQNLPKKSLLSWDPNDVHFILFPDSSNRSFEREIVYGNTASLKKSGLVANTNVRLFIHGATLNISTGGCIQLKNGFLKRNYKNIICINWHKLSTPNRSYIPETRPPILDGLVYSLIVQTSKIVAERIADFLIFLKAQNYLEKYEDVHLIGLSLGAHVVGGVGYHIQEQTKGRIGRITGLDPAGIIHDIGVEPDRYLLNKDQAVFVDIIHTDAGEFGTTKLAGHVDFFVNGARTVDQPACPGLMDIIGACGHRLSLDYYQRAILGEDLRGCPCTFRRKAPIKQPCPKPKNCKPTAKMGFPVPKSLYGNYYVTVPLKPPRGSAVERDYEPFNFTIF